MFRESKYKNFKTPNYLKRWINLKKVIPKCETLKSLKFDQDMKQWDNRAIIKKAKPHSSGMTSMLENLDITLDGRHHSGIDDARNLAKICIKLV